MSFLYFYQFSICIDSGRMNLILWPICVIYKENYGYVHLEMVEKQSCIGPSVHSRLGFHVVCVVGLFVGRERHR